jgi:hypothetical protein
MAFKTKAEVAAEAAVASKGWKRDKKTGLWKCFRADRRGETYSGTADQLRHHLGMPDPLRPAE